MTRAVLAVCTMVFATTSVEAVPIIYGTEAAYLAAITPDFEVNVGQDAAGNPFPVGTSQVLGSNIFSLGNDVNFSSPNGNNPTLVTVSPGHPELGPVGPGGQNWSGSLRLDLSIPAVAIGFGTHLLGTFNLELYAGGILLSSTVVNSGTGFGFVGVQELLGFDALVISTTNTFWSLDGGHMTAGDASPTQMVGQTAAPIPEPASVVLLGAGLAGLAARRRRRSHS